MNQKLTWDHQRMMHSWEKIKEMKKGHDSDVGDDYATYVTQLPAAILMNGLGQALAQLRAAAKQQENEPHELLYQHIQEWLCQDIPQTPYPQSDNLIEEIMKHDRKIYNWAVHETLAWLKWHKKFAATYLKKRKEESADGDTKTKESETQEENGSDSPL